MFMEVMSVYVGFFRFICIYVGLGCSLDGLYLQVFVNFCRGISVCVDSWSVYGYQ